MLLKGKNLAIKLEIQQLKDLAKTFLERRVHFWSDGPSENEEEDLRGAHSEG